MTRSRADATFAAPQDRRGLDVPAGKDAASIWPWWQTARAMLVTTTPNMEIALVDDKGQPAIRNDQPNPVAIHEIRLWTCEGLPAMNGHVARTAVASVYWQMETSMQGAIIPRWMQTYAFSNVDNIYQHGDGFTHCIRLPAPIRLQYTNPFALRLYYTGDDPTVPTPIWPPPAWMSNFNIHIALSGWDDRNGAPVLSTTRTLTLWPFLPGGAPVQQDYNVVFDDFRDRGMKDVWIDRILFGSINMAEEVPPAAITDFVFDRLGVKFDPPEGPAWSRDEFTHCKALFEQVDAFTLGPGPGFEVRYRPVVVHRPPRPYILRPGDFFKVKAKLRRNVATDTGLAWIDVYAMVRGVQEGTDA